MTSVLPYQPALPTPSLATERNLFPGVGSMGRAATLDNAMTACPMFSLSEAEARQIIGSIWAQVREWKMAFEQFGLPAETIEQAASAFRHIDTISTTKLRQALP